LAAELTQAALGLDTIESIARTSGAPRRRLWAGLWPKLAAVALVLTAWEAVVLTGWKPEHVLPGPLPVIHRLAADLSHVDFYLGFAVTMRRALVGYAIAVVLGSIVGLIVARATLIRKAVGSAILGLQSMPSIAWFPLAILLFQRSELAIILVVLLGAGPAVAGGLLNGVDHVQPLLVRVGLVMGARGLRLYRHVIFPAALPSFVGGLKLGWAFAWRSLMAGEIIGVLTHQASLGQQIQIARDKADATQLLALMIVIFVIGVAIDGVFSALDRAIRRRWGLLGADA
jgi:NitT/TauT family transport system permease protein